MRAIQRSQKKAALTTDEIWGRRERVVSKMTPRFRTVKDARILSCPMRMVRDEAEILCFKWIAKNSVFPLFSLRPFRGIHHRMSAMHTSRLATISRWASGELG